MPLHLITICIGFLIAFGLQQLVELFLRRRRSRKQQQAEEKSAALPPSDKPPSVD